MTGMKLLFTGLVLLMSMDLHATHLRGGQITIESSACVTRKYTITLTLYTDTGSPIQPGGGTLSFSDGNSIVIPTLGNVVLDSVNKFGQAIFIVDHLFPGAGHYTVSYLEHNRNPGILNFQDSGNTPFYIESMISIDPAFTCSPTLSFSIPPIDQACSGSAFTHNVGAQVAAGDSISFELIAPLQDENTPVTGYQNPNSMSFYPTNYANGNEDGTGPPVFQIDLNGTLLWDAPQAVGEYVVAIKVYDYRLIGGQWTVVGYVIRDLQILVEDCGAKRPSLETLSDVCVHPGDRLEKTIHGFNKSDLQVQITTTLADDFKSSPPHVVNQGVFQSTTPPADTANIKIDWTITCDLVRNQPYILIFKISSYTPGGNRLSAFQTMRVTVTGAPPAYKKLSLDVATKTLELEWETYGCTNIQDMQILRRVDRDNREPLACQTGVPASWGYQTIGRTAKATFSDPHLGAGATYCYRLLATFINPDLTVSVVSRDTCIGPILVDSPVLTKVSVAQTAKTTGAINLEWTSPFQINHTLFPPPYRYELYRTTDGIHYQTPVTVNSDTLYTDSNRDTQDSLFGYRVVVYSPSSIAGSNPIDTSSLAFYPRLAFQSLLKAVSLVWTDSVPWSDKSQRFPWHVVYRKEVADPVFQKIDSIASDTVTTMMFSYVDKGVVPFKENTVYVYKVRTEGAYGNPRLPEPLLNYSNEITAAPLDTSPPCMPSLTVTPNCETILNSVCSFADFKNTLAWVYPPNCGNDVAYYSIYFSESGAADSTLLTTTTSNDFVHARQNTLAGCYRILAVDLSGNKSRDTLVCADNCVNIFLPNIITTNDDGINETFPNLSELSDSRDPQKCPRFIKQFSCEIFDRWGQSVYRLANVTPGQPFSEWKGQDASGRDLATGVYYYSAHAVFNVRDAHQQVKDFNGWVYLTK